MEVDWGFLSRSFQRYNFFRMAQISEDAQNGCFKVNGEIEYLVHKFLLLGKQH